MIDKSEIIEISILQLLDSEDRWWTIEEISNLLYLSKATAQKYTTLLKLRCESFGNDQIYIEKSPSKGVFLHRSPTFAPQFIYAQVIQELLVFSVLDTFFNRKSNLLLTMAMDNFSSVASIRRKYQAINLRFLELELDISIIKDRIKGNERQIRWFYSKFYWKVFRGTEWPFPNLPRNVVEHRVKTIQNFYNLELPPEIKEEVMYWLAINWWRHLSGYRVKYDSEIEKYCLNHSQFPKFVKAMTLAFPEASRNNEKLNEVQIHYLFFLISALPLLEKNDLYNQHIYMAHQKSNTLIFRATQEWFIHYKKIFGFSLSLERRQSLEHNLLRIHSYSYLFKPKPYVIFEDYKRKEKKIYPKFNEALMKLYRIMNINYPSITINQSYILEHYIYLIKPLIDSKLFEQTFRICLSFSKGSIYERIAQENIIARFGKNYNLSFVHNNMDKDLLITDSPTFEGARTYLALHATHRLTERDFHHIENIFQSFLRNDE